MPSKFRVSSAVFETSAADANGWPPVDPDGGPAEIAFVGRSNVGKSSLLNALVERKGLARTSGAPGRTRLINFFRIEMIGSPKEHARRHTLRFVDLPGFGYAKVSKSERSTWRPVIERYLGARPALRVVVLLIDARRIPLAKEDEPQLDEERELLGWIAARGITVVPAVTKADKLAKHERAVAAERVSRWLGRAPVLVSAVTLDGRDALWARLLAPLGAAD